MTVCGHCDSHVDNKEAEQKRESEEKKTEETKEGEPGKEGQSTAMEVETEKKELVDTLESLSDQLILNSLWDTLSNCLKELAETPDHHAVLVLQVGFDPYDAVIFRLLPTA